MSPQFRQSRRKHDVVVTQQFRADAPEFPAVFIKIQSNATTQRRIGITYSMPDSFPLENLHFGEEWGEDYWTVDTDQHTITYARTLDPQMETQTIIGFKDIPLDMRETVLEAGPTISILDDDLEDADTGTAMTEPGPDSATGTATEGTADTTASLDDSTAGEISPDADSEEAEPDIQRDLGALETRVQTVEEDIQGFGVFENDLETLLGDPTDPLDTGQFHEMKQDLEILAELVSEVRTETAEIDGVQQQLEDLETTVEHLQSKFEESRADLTERLDNYEDRLEELERAHTESNVNIRDRINTLEETLNRQLDQQSNQEVTPDGG